MKLLASQQKKSQLEYLKSKAGVLIKQAGPPDNKPGSKTWLKEYCLLIFATAV